VKWNTPQGETVGTVEEMITEPQEVNGQKADASPEDPRYIVKSEKSGSKAVHKPDALKRA
ncbi:MAG: DUF2945 domain-containing protein, partial [Cyanobacteria bacterium P01_A01_bin.135]